MLSRIKKLVNTHNKKRHTYRPEKEQKRLNLKSLSPKIGKMKTTRQKFNASVTRSSPRMSKLLSPRPSKHIEMPYKYKTKAKKKKIDDSINRLYYNKINTKSPNRYPSSRDYSRSDFTSRRGLSSSMYKKLNKSRSSHSNFRRINRRLEELNISIGS